MKLFSDRALKDIANPRLLRRKEKTLLFRFHIRYRPGGTNLAADTLSRYPVERLNPTREDLNLEHELHVAALTAVVRCDEALTIDQDTIRQAAEEDASYLKLRQRVQTGDWPASPTAETGKLKTLYEVRHPRYMSKVNAQNKRIDGQFVYGPGRQRLSCAYAK